MDQETIDQAVRIATRAALYGQPVERIIWIPPATVTENPKGSFVIMTCPPLNATDKPPWSD